MEPQNYLGIYISKNAATVVCLAAQTRDRNVLGCFSVSVQEQDQPDWQTLANLIAQSCAEKGFEFSEVAVALDCAMFMQHKVHSEFDDPRQIAATVRFDTEEALAADVTDVAIAFNVTSTDQTGSEISVFTAQRKVLSDILLSLQSNNIDPVTIEPDVNCLSRFICRQVSAPQPPQPGTFFAMLSHRSAYLISFAESQKTPTMRTFLLGPAQDRSELLAREVPITATLTQTGEPVKHLKVLDSADSVDPRQLGERLGIETDSIDLAASVAASPEMLADCAGSVDFAIACGAALANLEKTQTTNFRNDFSPYQGRKAQLQKALKFASYSVTVLILALGVYFQMPLYRANKDHSELRKKLAKDYLAVMLNEKKLPAETREAVRKLGSELRRIESVRSGQISVTGEKSISAKLTSVFEAFNKCAAQTKLNVNSISITAKSISISGDTSSRANTLKLRKAIADAKLGSLQEHLKRTKSGRDGFSITITPEK